MRLNGMKAFRFKTNVSSHLKSDGRDTQHNLRRRLVSVPVPGELRRGTQRHPKPSTGKAEPRATRPIAQPVGKAAAQRKEKASRAAVMETAK